jgi:hypothetical protein
MTQKLQETLAHRPSVQDMVEGAKNLLGSVGVYHPEGKAGITADSDGSISLRNEKGSVLLTGSGSLLVEAPTTHTQGLHVLPNLMVGFCSLDPLFLSQLPHTFPLLNVLTTIGNPKSPIGAPVFTGPPIGVVTPHIHTIPTVVSKSLFGSNESWRLLQILEKAEALLQ